MLTSDYEIIPINHFILLIMKIFFKLELASKHLLIYLRIKKLEQCSPNLQLIRKLCSIYILDKMVIQLNNNNIT